MSKLYCIDLKVDIWLKKKRTKHSGEKSKKMKNQETFWSVMNPSIKKYDTLYFY